ncbi:hypothetical protein KEJ44_08080 [Candidatus Bathyarchaeota archaeon]|nr:hypothetical protein [Candidatus Bathyarchaeota archaeon]
MFDPGDGTFKEYLISNFAQLQGVSYGGGNIWYVDGLRSKAGYTKATIKSTIKSPTAFTEFQLPEGSKPTDIVPYNSTIVWISLLGDRSIAFLNISDAIRPSLTVFGLPERDGLKPVPGSIIFVEGSGCWYTDSGRGVIGQIPLYSNKTFIEDLGLIREWTLTKGRQPCDLAADAYGRIWFTDPTNGLIGVLNPVTNEVVEFEVPGFDARPYGITIDDSNNIWFTDKLRSSLWRYSQESRTFTEFKLQSKTPLYLTTGRDGISIWIVDFDGNLLIRFNPTVVRTTVYVTGLSQALPTGSYVTRFISRDIDAEKLILNTESKTPFTSMESGISTSHDITETVSIVRTSILHTETKTETVVFTVNSTTTAITTVVGSTVTGGTTTIMMTETYTSYITTINRTIVFTSILTAWNATAQAIPWGNSLHIGLGLAFGGLILALAARYRSRWRGPVRVCSPEA